ncbi:MAG: outer membrane protein [Candidatus Nucleicultricaceae bacterium]
MMKNKLAALLCVAASALTLSSVAEATQVGKFYGRLAGGYIFSDNVTFDIDTFNPAGPNAEQQRYNKVKTKGGFSGEVAFGYDFKASINRFPVVRGELAFGYKHRKVDDKNARYQAFAPAPGAVGTVAVDSKIQSFTLMANAYLDLIEYYRFVPYIGFGVGVSWNKLDALKTALAIGANPIVNETRPGKTQASLAWQLTAGTAYKFTPDWSLDLYYRYSDLGKVQTNRIVGNAYDDKAVAKLNNHEVMVGVRYTF